MEDYLVLNKLRNLESDKLIASYKRNLIRWCLLGNAAFIGIIVLSYVNNLVRHRFALFLNFPGIF